MSDADQVSQALAELWDIVKCRCHEAYTGRGLHDPDCECDSADALQTVGTAITTLRAQLAEARAEVEFMKTCGVIEMMVRNPNINSYVAEQDARADRAEAALAAPEVMHENAPAAILGEIGNQIHNLGCELQNDEDVSLRLSDLACRIWDAAKLFPTETTALDRYREKVLREAVETVTGWHPLAAGAILALIEKEKP